MCGIAGIVLSKPSSGKSAELGQLIDLLKHRGPDAKGLWSSKDNKAHFSHARLSILDLSDVGNQPFVSVDDRFTIVFNGEIYNYKALRIECENLGSQFKSNSDTEVVIEMYRHFGIGCFKKFRGMWAIVLHDQIKQQVIVSRDPFGIKPLYYSLSEGEFYFASEPSALSKVIKNGRQVDEVSKELYLDHGVLDRGQWTFFKKIKKVPQSCYSILNLNGELDQIVFSTYWDFDDYPKLKFNNLDEWTDAFKKKLKESIELHTVSDVEIGATLSGGLDSSSIVAFLHSNSHKFKTFSSDFSSVDKNIDETHFVDLVCNSLKIQNYKTAPEIKDFERCFDEVVSAQGEPFPTCSILSQFFVYKLIADNKVKVVLGGQGADETLGGYSYLQKLIIDEFKRINPFRYVYELILFYFIHKQKPVIKNSFYSHSSHSSQVKDFINFTYDGTVAERLKSLNFKPQGYNEYLKYLVFESNLPQILRYEDRNSMHFSIESRVPFLDPELVNLCFQIPVGFRYKAGFSKLLLREVLKGLVPEAVRTRRGKLGFPGPDQQVFKKLTGKDLDSTGSRLWRQMSYDYWEKKL